VKVLVTGASGFLGREVVAALLADGHAVRALVRPATDVAPLGWPAEVEVARADLRGGTDLAPLLADVEAVVHLATQMIGDDFTILSGTLAGTERLLAAMAGAGAKRLVLCSSFSVYDWSTARGVLDDDGPLPADIWPSGAYAAAKLWQERLARRAAAQNGWNLTVLRPGFVWGRGNDELACVGQRVGRFQLVFGPSRPLALTHVSNCADAFRAALTHDAAGGATFNLVDEQGISAARFARARRAATGGGPVLWLPSGAVRALVWLANRTARLVFGARYRLPSLFAPIRFDLRYKPVRATSSGLRSRLGWRAPRTFAECVQATWGPMKVSAAAPRAVPETPQSERRAA
jgi:nucleoside-diphosphate-sugar epimerase